MSDRNRYSLLRDIRSWKVGDVVGALKNNGLNECAEACQKREVDGETLLGLSEFALRLWGRDLNVGNMRKLSTFIQDVNEKPEKYIVTSYARHSDEWDTDWEDETEDKEGRKVLRNQKAKLKSVGQNSNPSLKNGNMFKHPPVDQNYNTRPQSNNASHVPKKIIPPPIFNNPDLSSNINGSDSKPFSSVRRLQQPHNNTINGGSLKLVSPSRQQNQTNAVNEINPKFLAEFQHSLNNFLSQKNEKTTLSSPNGQIQENGASVEKKPVPPPSFSKPQLPARPPAASFKSSPQPPLPHPPSSQPPLPQPPIQQQALPQPPIQQQSLPQPPFQQKVLPQPPIQQKILPQPPIQQKVLPQPPIQQKVLPQPPIQQQALPQPPTQLPTLPKPPTQLPTQPQPPLPKPPATENNEVILRNFIQSIPFEEPDDYESVDEELLRELHLRKQVVQISPSKGNYPRVEVPAKPPSRGRSPVPLPSAYDETSFLHSSQTSLNKFMTTANEEWPPREPSPVLKPRAHPSFHNQSSEEGSLPAEDVYESIPDHTSNGESTCEYTDGYLKPIESVIAPELPPKPKLYVEEDANQPPMLQKTDSSTGGSLWSIGSLRRKASVNGTLNKPEKSLTPDGKKSNTPTLSRPSQEQRQGVTRPLPPTPDASENTQRPTIKIPLVQMPWYFNVDRKRGEEILRNYGNGTFMIRPSTQTQNPLTLTLKYTERTFNIVVRHRLDGRYALGTEKPTEENFSSVEELVNHYMQSGLALYSNGKPAGSVVLTTPPRKDNSFL